MAKFTVAVMGLGRFGSALAQRLEDSGVAVLGVDTSEEIVQGLSETIRHLAVAEARDPETLTQLGVTEDTLVVLGMTNVQASLLCLTACTTLGVREIWAKAGSQQHAKALSRLGVMRIIQPERDAGLQMAAELLNRR
ncbi:TrkA family potassium uptake protein [Janibacter sp. GXQ6167]|uniref:potassium channel family protein n=1 Tax=Janibacter sp. GXQ6167 TaxID=3240791 RepID=UPI003525C5F1